MRYTDIFIKRPVLATVISLMLLAMGLRSINSLPIMQYPFTENAIVTVTTTYTGADPDVIAGFITTPLENSIAQANGIDYMTSISSPSTSTITVNLRLNYDPLKALSDITTKVNAVLNQLPKNSQQPVITVSVGQTIDSMYIGFYSDELPINKITDYIIRVVQPKLQAVNGVQNAQILGNQTFALRAWLDPVKLAGYGISAAEIGAALANNDFISAVGRTDGQMFIQNLTASTNLTDVNQFKKMVIKAQNGAIIHLEDVATVSLGAQNYNSSVSFDGRTAVYVGILVAPSANLLTVIDDIKKIFPTIQEQLPQGLNGKIVYDASLFVHSSIHEVIVSLLEAFLIVTAVIFLFLGSMRSVLIPIVAIPLSLIGAFWIMLILGYSINLLTLLALVLAIGLVVDDAIIVVENVQRHIEEGQTRLKAALLGARELANPIIAITIVLIAVYLPIGFMGGLTGALFTEFAFSLAGAVTVSAVIALTLSPMMCSKLLKIGNGGAKESFMAYIDRLFARLERFYERILASTLKHLSVVVVFAIIILASNYFLFITSASELAPQEDLGVIIAQVTAPANSSLDQTKMYADEVGKIFKKYPETDHIFQVDGSQGLNTSIIGMVLKPWDQRQRTTNQLQPLIQKELKQIAGAKVAAFQLPSLPGGGSGLPIQFVITTTEPFDNLNLVLQSILDKAHSSGIFAYIDPDLKIDQIQTKVNLDRDKIAEFGLTMQDIGNLFGSALSEGYINYFNYAGRSYQVIPQVKRESRLNTDELLNYYIKTSSGASVPLSTVAELQRQIVPESLNHFQQLNSATISAVAFPGVTMGHALETLANIANQTLPQGYYIDYGAQSRQFIQEGANLIFTFFFALIIIFLALSALFESFRDPLIVLISVPMSICGAMIFVSLGIGHATLNIYSEVGLVTLIGLISKHGILIVQFANDLQAEGQKKLAAIKAAAAIRLRPILMTTAAMVLGVIPLIFATGAGAESRFNIGLVIAMGISIGTLFTLFVVPAMYLLLAADHAKRATPEDEEFI
ncbi:efflux RND transporter permease subunit [Legionella longbeachae]|uniref:Putative multidrug efflux transporter n=1 Tax=Legionella longbeachae serogroup 1 (strain NSW150) TaxID=661367 RepID=D3HPR6_LEGLN|nr:efflux RND transporter permease subunit [Legionella longbeachae]VEE01402.1 multidrug efflux transporter [Legionella oakridgensis]ARB92234.1 multidrug efflux protein [Legionella longbeachae]ARM34585.1 MMPL family transporter [Legionella longbeachae]QIN31344.1 MMPL family transporter [Legionella longbeachae]QIN34697.1 MMPL family transporter [Legionella longbeachae]